MPKAELLKILVRSPLTAFCVDLHPPLFPPSRLHLTDPDHVEIADGDRPRVDKTPRRAFRTRRPISLRSNDMRNRLPLKNPLRKEFVDRLQLLGTEIESPASFMQHPRIFIFRVSSLIQPLLQRTSPTFAAAVAQTGTLFRLEFRTDRPSYSEGRSNTSSNTPEMRRRDRTENSFSGARSHSCIAPSRLFPTEPNAV